MLIVISIFVVGAWLLPLAAPIDPYLKQHYEGRNHQHEKPSPKMELACVVHRCVVGSGRLCRLRFILKLVGAGLGRSGGLGFL